MIQVVNPSTRDVVAVVAAAGRSETELAVCAADAALPAWRLKTARARSVIIHRWYELMIEHREDLAKLMTAEQGKPLAESRGEINYSADYVRWFSEEAVRVSGSTWPGPATDRRAMSMLQPIGVTAAVTPWNFPCAMLARKASKAPATASPCSRPRHPPTPIAASPGVSRWQDRQQPLWLQAAPWRVLPTVIPARSIRRSLLTVLGTGRWQSQASSHLSAR